jgi:hypothetical protein
MLKGYAPCRYWGVNSPVGVTNPFFTKKASAFSGEDVRSLCRDAIASLVFCNS